MAAPFEPSPLLLPRERAKDPPLLPHQRPGRSPVKQRASLKHRTRSPTDSVKESEMSLHKLLEDFEEGKLNAFANSDVLQQLSDIREMQEKLTIRHFEIDQMRIRHDESSTEGYKDEAALRELTQTLEKLGTMIQSLHTAGAAGDHDSFAPSSSSSSIPGSSSDQ